MIGCVEGVAEQRIGGKGARLEQGEGEGFKK